MLDRKRAPNEVLELLQARNKRSENLRNQLGILASTIARLNWFRPDWVRSPDVSVTVLTSQREEAETLWEELLKVHSSLTGVVSVTSEDIVGYPDLAPDMLDTWTDDWVDMVEKEVNGADYLLERLQQSGFAQGEIPPSREGVANPFVRPTGGDDLVSLVTPPDEEGANAVDATPPSATTLLQSGGSSEEDYENEMSILKTASMLRRAEEDGKLYEEEARRALRELSVEKDKLQEMTRAVLFLKGKLKEEERAKEKALVEKEIFQCKLQKASKEQEQLWMKEMGKIISFYKSQLVKEGGVYQPEIGTGGVQQPLNVTKVNAKQDSTMQLDEENNEEFVKVDEECKIVENLEEKERQTLKQTRLNHFEAQRIEEGRSEDARIEDARVKEARIQDARKEATRREATRREAARMEATLFQQHLEAERRCNDKRWERMHFYSWPIYYSQVDLFGWPMFYQPHCVIWHSVPYCGSPCWY